MVYSIEASKYSPLFTLRIYTISYIEVEPSGHQIFLHKNSTKSVISETSSFRFPNLFQLGRQIITARRRPRPFATVSMLEACREPNFCF